VRNLVLVLVLGCLVYLNIPYCTQKEDVLYQKAMFSKEVDSWSTLTSELGVEFPEVLLAQICLETGGLTSKIYKTCNNVTGMKYNSRGYAVGVCRGHARYPTVLDCLRDYSAYQKKYLKWYRENRRKVTTNKEYVEFLCNMNYAEDKKYASKLHYWLKKVKQK